MKNCGFTLIELLVVATIISLLSGIGLVSYSQFVKKSRDERRKADLNNIRSALEMYRSDRDSYPTNLTKLTTSTPKYLEKIPEDPKGYDYVYEVSPSGCDETTVICSDYTLYAYLETGGGCGVASPPNCGGVVCNYCVGPYGEK